MNNYHECARCGEELGDEYVVHEYPIPHPVKRGEMNPASVYGIMAIGNAVDLLVGNPENVGWDFETSVDVATHEDCRRPLYPPRTDVEEHYMEALFTGVLAWGGVLSFSTPETTFVEAAVVTVVFGALFLGEMYQIGLHKTTDDHQLFHDTRGREETVDGDENPAEVAVEEFLAGEIGEDELEARLDESEAEAIDETEPELVER